MVDPTPFVRDPAIRARALTATRSWTVERAPRLAALAGSPIADGSRGSTQTTRPVGGTDVVYIELTHPDRAMPMPMPAITWRLDGQVVADAANSLTLPAGRRSAHPGHAHLTVTLGPARRDAAGHAHVDRRQHAADGVLHAVAGRRLVADRRRQPHVFMRDEFTMKLEPRDDQPGYVVAEFRVNGDGWHHYYGWPDAPPGTPFKFTPRGTNIKELIYGSLSAEGLVAAAVGAARAGLGHASRRVPRDRRGRQHRSGQKLPRHRHARACGARRR